MMRTHATIDSLTKRPFLCHNDWHMTQEDQAPKDRSSGDTSSPTSADGSHAASSAPSDQSSGENTSSEGAASTSASDASSSGDAQNRSGVSAKSKRRGTYHTILVPARLQVDTVIAALLLQEYGESTFEGVSSAQIEYVKELPEGKSAMQLEKEGVIVIDMGGGRFDHHRKTRAEEQECVSLILAKYLGIDTDPALNKILTFAQRDDVEGRGIISKDRIDRAFGFSGLFNTIVRDHPKDPHRVFQIVRPVLLAHIHEERTRNHVLPKEYMTRFDNGDVVAFTVQHKGKTIRAITIDSDRRGMIGFLRAHPSIKADIVAQRFSSGHINIVTNQQTRMDLSHVAGLVRIAELVARNASLEMVPADRLSQKGVLEDIPQWYVDTAAHSIQNGGVDPDGWPATALNLKEVQESIELGLHPRAYKKMSLSKRIKEAADVYKNMVHSFARAVDGNEDRSPTASHGRTSGGRKSGSSHGGSSMGTGNSTSNGNKRRRRRKRTGGGGQSLEQLVKQRKEQ